ncbi:hypothetical protein [Streptomyces sp. NPDC046985]|uniref:hypothetical protein n=1 Tax=Streptomyces sp. NPDC046985 TaxID=3155377 RepID=UPI0033F84637
MDTGALGQAVATGGVALLVGMLTWTQGQRAARRSDFTTIAAELRTDLNSERKQRRVLTSYVLDIWRWAEQVGPDTPAGPPPPPPENLDLTPWR